MRPVLTIHNAVKRFGKTTALDGAGLELRPSECLALLGPNGAGKTTLVRAIAGRVRLDEGEVALFGSTLLPGTTKGRERLGLVPQELALYMELSGRENLRHFGRLAGLSPGQLAERVPWALRWAELEDRAEDLVQTYSGGMKRRLNLASGVLHRPAVLLLDEPTVGVDPQSRQRLWEMLSRLREEGTSLLLTTHQLDEAQKVADRITIVDHGQVLITGTFEDLVRETVGSGRRISVRLEGEAPERLSLPGFEISGRTVQGRLQRVGVELPNLIHDLERMGCTVADLDLEAPSLQNVFIHLTGRELRE